MSRKDAPLNPKLFRRVWRDYLRSRVGVLLLATLMMAIDGASLGALSYYIKPLIDDVFVAADRSALAPVALALFLIFAVRAVSAYGQKTLTMKVGLDVISGLQRDLSRHLMTLDPAFYHGHSPGALLERVRGDSQTLLQVASSALITLGRDTISLIALVTVAALADWQWTLMAFVGIPLIALPIVQLQKLVRRATLKARVASADLTTRLDEMFHGIKAIKSNRMENYEQQRVESGVEEFRHRMFQAERNKAALPALIDVIAGLGFVAVMIYGGQQIIDGEKTLGDFMSFFTALALLFDPIRRLAGLGGNLSAASVNLQRLYDLFDQRPEIVNRPSAQPLANANADVLFDDVRFGYHPDQPVLNGLSLTAPAGKVTALVGSSGSGKTTLFNLLCRFYEPQSGSVRIGDQDVRDVTLESLRDHIALVSQETALFDESLYHNIAYGRPDALPDEIETAARHARVSDFAARLPSGLETPAGPRGSNLSGGQRQRTVIARALLRDAPILLLDEATSALDRETEQQIQTAIAELTRGRTSLIIAHRLSTIRQADRIHVIDAGRVVESGSHEELMARGGKYAELNREFTE